MSKFKFETVFVIAAAALGLTGCATYDRSTVEGEAIYQRDLAASQEILARSQQAAPNYQLPAYQAPAVAPIGQPNNTAIVYCRDLTGTIIACKQVR